ncbi:hypothetical protein, partial [Streptomyces marokkonensis]|uniref:hypothetical protein n=1 Tax=Streptomyces marokkonensis TaxID=324855 RepID=UPI0031EF0B23
IGRQGSREEFAADLHPTLVVLLPALREQSLVAATLRFYATVRYPGLLVPIVVTSRKEDHDRQRQLDLLKEAWEGDCPPRSDGDVKRVLAALLSPSDCAAVAHEVLSIPAHDVAGRGAAARSALHALPTTAEVVETAIRELNARGGARTCYHVSYPRITGRKGSQLNHAVALLEQLDPGVPVDPENTLVAVFDFDALPHPRTFVDVGAEAARRRAAQKPIPAMLQQVQLPFNFRSSFAKGIDGLLMRGQVLYWLRRGLAIETGRLLVKRSLDRRRLPHLVRGLVRPMIYGIGSGMFFRLDALRVAGPFPEPHDDLAMGYRASFLGWDIVPVPSFNLTEPYYTCASMVRAWASVCYGGTRVRDDLHHVRERATTLRRWEQWALVCKEWLDTFVWFAGCLLVPAAVVVTATAGPVWSLLVAAALLLAYPVTALALLALLPRLRGQLGDTSRSWITDWRTAAALVALFILQPFVSATGPWSLAKSALTSGRRGADLVNGKTER